MTRSAAIAEDDPEIQELLQFKLRANDFDVTTFEDGQSCIKHLEQHGHEFDVVILDIMMPRTDGFQVLEHIRTDDSLSELPVLLLTARARESDVVEGFERGATDYMTKPFSPAEVVARVERLTEA
jgi:DNA-binding response OmpR family regulator